LKVKELKELLEDIPDNYIVVGREIDLHGDMGGPCYHLIEYVREMEQPKETVILGGNVMDDGHPIYGVPSREDFDEDEFYPWEEIGEWPYHRHLEKPKEKNEG
jgi:hypothetical protein